jgi:hypothetical protein
MNEKDFNKKSFRLFQRLALKEARYWAEHQKAQQQLDITLEFRWHIKPTMSEDEAAKQFNRFNMDKHIHSLTSFVEKYWNDWRKSFDLEECKGLLPPLSSFKDKLDQALEAQ